MRSRICLFRGIDCNASNLELSSRNSRENVAALSKSLVGNFAEVEGLVNRLFGIDKTTAVARIPLESSLEERLPEKTSFAIGLISYSFGCVFGRWDIRYATGERPAPELPDPFAPLPVCPPGMLQGDDGLPLSPEAGRRLRAEGRYPLDVAWDGILVDDPEHPLDLERRIHAALAVLWGDRADALEHEACALLGVPTLREWFRRPAGFFADHLKRYSKSRRQAPIYWPLSTASGSYTLWLYYHRLNARHALPLVNRIRRSRSVDVEKSIARLRLRVTNADGRHRAKRAQAGRTGDLRSELIELRDELVPGHSSGSRT